MTALPSRPTGAAAAVVLAKALMLGLPKEAVAAAGVTRRQPGHFTARGRGLPPWLLPLPPPPPPYPRLVLRRPPLSTAEPVPLASTSLATSGGCRRCGPTPAVGASQSTDFRATDDVGEGRGGGE